MNTKNLKKNVQRYLPTSKLYDKSIKRPSKSETIPFQFSFEKGSVVSYGYEVIFTYRKVFCPIS
jgi:hypothetical protein